MASPDEIARQIDSLIENAIPQLTAPMGPTPTFGGVNLDASKAELLNARSSRDEFRTATDKGQQEFGEATGRFKTAVDRKAEADAALAEADARRAEEIARNNAFYRDIFGLTPDQNADIAILARLSRKEQEALQEKLRILQEKQKVSLFDNPLEWLMNTIELPNLEQDYNRQADIVNNIQTRLDANIKTAQNAAAFSAKAIPEITAAQAAAKAEQARAAADQLKSVADRELAKANIGFASEKFAKDIAVANATNDMSRLQIANEEAKYRSAIAAIQLADTQVQRQLNAAKLLEMLQKNKSMDAAFDTYDTIMGNPKGTTTRYSFERMSTAQKENVVAIAAGNFGSGPWTAVNNFIAGRPGPHLSPDVQRLAMYLRDKGDNVQIDPTIPRSDKVAIAAARDEGLRKTIIAELMRPKMGGLFYELSPNVMLNSGLVQKDSRLGKVLSGFSGQTGPVPTDAVVNAIMLEFENPTEAGQVVAEYYRQNINKRNTAMNLSAFGIPPVPNYLVKPPGWFSGKALDLTNPAEATKYILKKKTDYTMQSLGGFNQNTINPFAGAAGTP